MLVWPALSFAAVGACYLKLGPAPLGKRQDGLIALWSLFLFGPYLFLCWGLWRLLRRFSPEPCYHEVAPGLFLGRRAYGDEIPDGVSLLVDLTAEFFEPGSA